MKYNMYLYIYLPTVGILPKKSPYVVSIQMLLNENQRQHNEFAVEEVRKVLIVMCYCSIESVTANVDL